MRVEPHRGAHSANELSIPVFFQYFFEVPKVQYLMGALVRALHDDSFSKVSPEHITAHDYDDEANVFGA